MKDEQSLLEISWGCVDGGGTEARGRGRAEMVVLRRRVVTVRSALVGFIFGEWGVEACGCEYGCDILVLWFLKRQFRFAAGDEVYWMISV